MNEQVERDLGELIRVLVAEIPRLEEVRVYGSYNNGFWNEEKSDVDVLVLINDEAYSIDRDRRSLPEYRSIESEFRQRLRNQVTNELTGKYSKRFSLSFLTRRDLRSLDGVDEGRGNIGKAMRNGRLLYRPKHL